MFVRIVLLPAGGERRVILQTVRVVREEPHILFEVFNFVTTCIELINLPMKSEEKC
jgi:hypothetical protein